VVQVEAELERVPAVSRAKALAAEEQEAPSRVARQSQPVLASPGGAATRTEDESTDLHLRAHMDVSPQLKLLMAQTGGRRYVG
jgi:hypothetical protein